MEQNGYWVERPTCITQHDVTAHGREIAGSGWRDLPQHQHEHFELISGAWVAAPDCEFMHKPRHQNVEAPIGYRNRGEGYDHEHWVPIVPEDPFADSTPEAPAEPDVLTQYHAMIHVQDHMGKQVLDLKIVGSAHVVSAIMQWSADAFKEDVER